MTDTYYDLGLEDRWLPKTDHPGSIGNRPTDFSIVSLNLRVTIKTMFPAGLAPDDIEQSLVALEGQLQASEWMVQDFVERVSLYVQANKPPEPVSELVRELEDFG